MVEIVIGDKPGNPWLHTILALIRASAAALSQQTLPLLPLLGGRRPVGRGLRRRSVAFLRAHEILVLLVLLIAVATAFPGKQEGNLLGGLWYLSISILSDNISRILVNSG